MYRESGTFSIARFLMLPPSCPLQVGQQVSLGRQLEQTRCPAWHWGGNIVEHAMSGLSISSTSRTTLLKAQYYLSPSLERKTFVTRQNFLLTQRGLGRTVCGRRYYSNLLCLTPEGLGVGHSRSRQGTRREKQGRCQG